MLESYILMYKDIKLGKITYDIEEDKFSFEKFHVESKVNLYPPEFYGFLKPNYDSEPSSKSILSFFESRIPPRNRQCLELILQKWNMNNYNPWLICKHTRAVNMDDYYWLNSGDEKYENVHPRYYLDKKVEIPKFIFKRI